MFAGRCRRVRLAAIEAVCGVVCVRMCVCVCVCVCLCVCLCVWMAGWMAGWYSAVSGHPSEMRWISVSIDSCPSRRRAAAILARGCGGQPWLLNFVQFAGRRHVASLDATWRHTRHARWTILCFSHRICTLFCSTAAKTQRTLEPPPRWGSRWAELVSGGDGHGGGQMSPDAEGRCPGIYVSILRAQSITKPGWARHG